MTVKNFVMYGMASAAEMSHGLLHFEISAIDITDKMLFCTLYITSFIFSHLNLDILPPQYSKT